METLTDILIKANGKDLALDYEFRRGVDSALYRNVPSLEHSLHRARKAQALIRWEYGFEKLHTNVLTPPSANLKLNKSVIPSYGLTLQHHVTAFDYGRTRIVVNACPSARSCVKLCVLSNGHGGRQVVVQARKARTALWVRHPESAAFLLGHDLALAVKKEGKILFRPNVNSDVEWQHILPSLTGGVVFGNNVISYGYSKLPQALDGNGWQDSHYRVAYSVSEISPPWEHVSRFLARGGSVAVVTDRKVGDPVMRGFDWYEVRDADLSDEWILWSSVLGDLAFKRSSKTSLEEGIASGFILQRYTTAGAHASITKETT